MVNRQDVRVIISVMGSFQAYRLAAQMERLGVLGRIYTSNWRSVDGVPRWKVRNYLLVSGANYAMNRLLGMNITSRALRVYDAVVARSLRGLNPAEHRVFHGWAGFSLKSLYVAKEYGMLAVLDRACPHMVFQRDLLRAEAERQGIRFPDEGFPIADVRRCTEEYETANLIIVPSQYSYESFRAAGVPESKLCIVPLGVQQIDQERRPRATDRVFRVLYVGGDPLRKGLRYMLDAWRGLRLPESELILRGTVASELRGLARDPSIRVIPKVSKEELYDLYRKATIFCLPSVDDGFGMAALEAMAFGLAVIVSQHVGAKDVIRDGVDGFVVPVGDTETLKERIAFFYEHREAVDVMGVAAFARASALSWEVYGERMLEIYTRREDAREHCEG